MGTLRRWVNLLAGALVVVVMALGAVAVEAQRAPGCDDVAAGVAHWGRSHGLGRELGWVEHLRHDGG